MPKHFYPLLLTIVAEVVATSAIPATQQFTRLWPSLVVVIGYALSFYFMSVTAKYMTIGVIYAIWAGFGVVGVAIIGYVYYGQKQDLAAIAGMALIVAGVLVINLFSRTATH